MKEKITFKSKMKLRYILRCKLAIFLKTYFGYENKVYKALWKLNSQDIQRRIDLLNRIENDEYYINDKYYEKA